jgi:PAS domain S-box-containing protein
MESAFQGEEGLTKVERALAAEKPYALAFVDMRMPPGWDGLETIRRLWQVYPELEVVICTAYSDHSWHQIQQTLGINERLLILKKPFDKVEVEQLALALTEKWNLRRLAYLRTQNLEELVRLSIGGLYDEKKKLERSEAYFRNLTENALDLITLLDPAGTVRYQSSSIHPVLGYRPEELSGKPILDFVHADDAAAFGQALANAREKRGNNTSVFAFRMRHRDGSWRELEARANDLFAEPAVCGMVLNSRDVTERKQLEQQFLQSQKVQAVGQLAGGIAHDFNNILTAILGFTDLLLKQLPSGEGLRSNAEEIKKAATRAASLTKQLLAFSRKQALRPRVLDLNGVVSEMNSMLRRLLGERISLVTLLHGDLGRVKADPGQIEQVIMNIAVNARDAMSGQGKLIIETGNVRLDAQYCHGRPEVNPGEYVMLALSDNGAGMTAEVRTRLFEPFFTTKELGKGTGLGLATCHGIIKQSGGHINVHSEVNQGTTFKIYLPRIGEALDANPEREQPTHLHSGHETVLFVEDEPMLRELGVVVLSGLGYRVIPADNGVQALRVFHQHPGPEIHLLVTDVIMPEMGGKELAERLRLVSPRTKVLFCSGYTEAATMDEGRLDPKSCFLQKPYDIVALAGKVREVLESAA